MHFPPIKLLYIVFQITRSAIYTRQDGKCLGRAPQGGSMAVCSLYVVVAPPSLLTCLCWPHKELDTGGSSPLCRAAVGLHFHEGWGQQLCSTQGEQRGGHTHFSTLEWASLLIKDGKFPCPLHSCAFHFRVGGS